MPQSSTLALTQTQKKYLDVYMNKVSRSFALVVPFVEEPLNHYLAVSYLICRVADNIEDCAQPLTWQAKRFAELKILLHNPQFASQTLKGWSKLLWPGLTADEEEIMTQPNGLPLWQIYALIPSKFQEIITQWVSEMIDGMRNADTLQRAPQYVNQNGIQLTATERDYNNYCYYVAGTVGFMATELVITHYNLPDEVAGKLLRYCQACGRGLQKTNIIKDFPKDLKRHISYLPYEWMREINCAPLALKGAPLAWKAKVIGNVLSELADSVNYVLALPDQIAGYRMASLLCLLPAYQTLLRAVKSGSTLFTIDHYIKIPRETMASCLSDAQRLVNDNDSILNYTRNIAGAIEAELSSSQLVPSL